MFAYDKNRLIDLLDKLISTNVKPEGISWLNEQSRAFKQNGDTTKFNIGFVAIPRKTGKEKLPLSDAQRETIQSIRPGASFQEWTIDRLSRVWWLLQLDATSKEKYFDVIENLFLNAEMNELIALYSSLPFLAYPEMWRKRCAEGIRSNIAQVLEAIMCDNPYPAEQLDEAAWNQLVLKAIFTEKPFLKIYGLRDRSNQHLADSISAFAHERWAAHRTVNPLVWMCLIKFLNEENLKDLRHLLDSHDLHDRVAAGMVCLEGAFPPAMKLLSEYKDVKDQIEKEKYTWQKLAVQMDEARL